MFRDLKEYQEIAKIYAEKVSKPENLEERRGANLSQDQIDKNRQAFKNTILFGNKEGNRPDTSNSNRRALLSKNKQINKEKPIPSTDQIRKDNPKVVPGTRVNEIGAEGGGKPSEGNFKKDFPDKPVVSNLTKQGKERTPAQIAAAKRIASGKTIQQVKDENLQSIKNKAKLKNTDFQAMKKGDMSKDDFVKKYPNSNLAKKMKEEYTPYDYVLEYLLSSEQVATIEEANYVMTEMDAETIQGIVEAQKKTLMKEQG